MYKYTDYLETYGRIMQFNKNKTEPFHKWYPFVEGYSKEFINSILLEMKSNSLVCLEPFSGSGTTALELQRNQIDCFSFEVNPLMYLVAKVKLEKNYNVNSVRDWFSFICDNRVECQIGELTSAFRTLYEEQGKKRWNYDIGVAIAIQKLFVTINNISDVKYKELYTVALAAILLDVSNLYRNGKCLSYKKNWEERILTEEDVFSRFDKKVKDDIIEDISQYLYKTQTDNKKKLYNLDSREGIEKYIMDSSIDLVITSPPYLNSRDYTDTYMLELKTLGFTSNTQEVRNLREKTLRSHVQIKWNDKTTIENVILKKTLKMLEEASVKENVWNNSILDMIRLYFVDMQTIFRILYKKLKRGGRIYFNVSNSAYFNVLINTLEICASIAEEQGFKVIEIRKARYLKTSPQQKKHVEQLLEGVIVLEKE